MTEYQNAVYEYSVRFYVTFFSGVFFFFYKQFKFYFSSSKYLEFFENIPALSKKIVCGALIPVIEFARCLVESK